MKKAIVIAAAIVIAGAMLPLAVMKFKSYDRTVDVKGLCEREVKADKVIWPISFKIVDDDLNSALASSEAGTATIVNFLKDGGIAESDITVTAPSISDKYANEYGNNDRLYRFLISNTVTVCTASVDEVLELQKRETELMKKGIVLVEDNWEHATSFMFEGLNDIKPSMIEEATANAREAAQKFAKDSDSRLGKIKNATQGTFSIESRDSNTPYIKKVRVVTYITYYIRH